MYYFCCSIKFSESSSSSDDEETSSKGIQYYSDDKELPVFSTTSAGYLAEQVAKVLLNPNLDKVCHVQPLGVTKNATFIVDVDDVAFSDLKADDLGTWKTNGTKTTHFWIRPSGTIVISPKQKGPDTKSYIMTRRYYVHGTYQLFRRIIIDIKGIFQYTLVCNFIAFSCIDGNGQRHKYALVQYLFDGPEVEVKIKPHGNSSHARPYFRTSESTKQRLQEISATQKPKEAINVLMMEKGGEVHARGAGCVPRDSRQISYLREKKHTKDPNPLYSVMLECKLAQGKTEMFVQDVKAAPQPMCVLSFNVNLMTWNVF